MEQLINEIRAYAAARGVKPSTVLQKAGGFGGTVWATWEAGTAGCTLAMAARIRAYMQANPVPVQDPAGDVEFRHREAS